MGKIAIIGGGAAGLAAAVAAGPSLGIPLSPALSQDHQEDVSITVFERADRVGKTILATGNGRCNFSNSAIAPEVYHNSSFVSDSFSELSPQEVREFFSELGLIWVEEAGGRLFPLTNKSASVLDVLRFSLSEKRVELRCSTSVIRIDKEKDCFCVVTDKGKLLFDAVIIASGGLHTASLLSGDHALNPLVPMLGPLATDTVFIRGLNNIRVKCALSCAGQHEVGEVLFRDFGVSGIAVFNLSRFALPGDVLSIDFLPHLSSEALEELMLDRLEHFGYRSSVDFFAGMLQSAVARSVVQMAGVREDVPLCVSDVSHLVHTLKHFDLRVKGIADPTRCQVHRGGFTINNFNPKTMGSLREEGLFVVGEALDVEGPCGGFNLHWAWTSGILAGRAAFDLVSKR